MKQNKNTKIQMSVREEAWELCHSGESHVMTEAAEKSQLRSHRKLEEARNRFAPEPWGSMALLTLGFWPSETDFLLLNSRTTESDFLLL